MKINKKHSLLFLPFLLISCGKQENVHEHLKQEAYSKDEIGHYHSCSCEEDIRFDFEPHNFTKNNEGILSCSVCGYIKDEAKEEAWKIIKKSLAKSLEYNGPLTAKQCTEMIDGEMKMRMSSLLTSEPSTGKFLETSLSEAYDPESSKWITAEKTFKKTEINEEKFILYEGTPDSTNSSFADKEYANSVDAFNPWALLGDLFYGKENSLTNIFLRMDSYQEAKEMIPIILKLFNGNSSDFNFDIEIKENLYSMLIYGGGLSYSSSRGIKLGEETGDMYFSFNKDTFVSYQLINKVKEEAVNEANSSENKMNALVSFDYGFDSKTYDETIIENKETPTTYEEGYINIAFDDYLWKKAFRQDVNVTVNSIAKANDLELYYDKQMKKKVTDEEMFSTSPKTYYAQPLINPKKAYVLDLRETNYVTGSILKKYASEYTEKWVSGLFLYSSEGETHLIDRYGYPSDDDKEKYNIRITLDGQAYEDKKDFIVSLGKLYKVLIKKDEIARFN